MRHHLHRGPALRPAIATAAAAAIVVSAVAVPAAAGAASVPAGPTGAAAASRPAARPVLLINGDRLAVRPALRGGSAIALLPAARHDSVLSLKLGRLIEEIPADALPYLGRGLEPSLFSLSALQHAEAGGRLPVQVSFAGRRPALPGVTITRWSSKSAEGYLTISSARIFGAALERQFRADHGRASYGADGLFGGGVRIALAGAPAAAARVGHPDFPMHTLTVTGTNLAGNRDRGDGVWVFNADNVARFGDPVESFNVFDHGVAKFSVPSGHYWAIGDFLNFKGTGSSERLDFLPQFTVRRNTTVHVAERAASSEITMLTPRPAVTQTVSLEVIRGGLHGSSFSFTWSDSGLSLWVSPTKRAPTVGTLRSYASATLTSPRGKGTPYAYNLNFAGPAGLIPAQHYVIRSASLATLNERYYQDVRSTGAWTVFGGFPAQLEGLIIGEFLPLKLPGLQTQYMSAARTETWLSSYAEFNPADFFPWGGQSDGNFRFLPAGRQQTVDWNRFPLHPQPDVQLLHGRLASLFPQFPSAFRAGNALSLGLAAFSDNELGHLGAGFSVGPRAAVTGSYAISQDGVPIAHGNPVNGIPTVHLTPSPSVVRFTLTATRLSKLFPQSSSSTTVWTWRSARAPKAHLPPSWYCGFTVVGQQFRLLRRCAVQPLLTLNYQVQGLALDGSTRPGPQVINLAVGHLQVASGSPVTGASARVSYDDGQIWQRASVTPTGAGHFRITFTAPAGVDVTLRVHAADKAGGSITETILRAYGIAL